MSESQLRRRIVHNDNMPHPRSRRAAANACAFDDRRSQPATRALHRARRTHNARSHNDHVPGLAHSGMPAENGSSGFRMSRLSAVTKAEPVMLGMSLPSRSSYDPSNTVSRMP